MCGSRRARVFAGTDSFTHRLVQADSPDHTVPVTRVTKASLDDFFESHDVRPPSLVKIDVEGHEGHVLEGMHGILRSFSPRLLLEVHDRRAAEQCRRVLEATGYSLFDLVKGTRASLSDWEGRSWYLCGRSEYQS